MENFRFTRVEFAGSLGDLGTLIPLAVGLIVINGLSSSIVLLLVGIFYISAGIYFKIPVPVQPLKVVSAIAIALGPKIVTPEVLAASSLLFGVILIAISITGIIDFLGRFFTKPIIRGIQLGLGLILVSKALVLITIPQLFIVPGMIMPRFIQGIPLSQNLIFGIAGFFLALILINSKRYPAALVIIIAGAAIGLFMGGTRGMSFSPGPTEIRLFFPNKANFMSAFFLLVLPQIPLTIGNAIISTGDTAKGLFGVEKAKKVTYKALGMSMGIVNIIVGAFGGMPMCHGTGGMAAHYRFGARTAGSNIMIGLIFVVLALLFGKASVSLLTSIPASVLGVLLLFAGLELALLVKDLKNINDYFISLLIAGIAVATTNMSYAFIAGISVKYIIDTMKIEL